MKKTWGHGGNKPYLLALQFLWTVGDKAFNHGRPTKGFFRVYKFYQKLDETMLDLFHEYLDAHGQDKELTMKALFVNAPCWNQMQRTTKVSETKTEDYLALLKEW